MDRSDVSEAHGVHQLLAQIGPNMLVLVDAGITSAGFFEHVRRQGGHALGALQAGTWEHLPHQRRLADGSRLSWVPPTRNAQYPSQRGMWVRIISYRVTDERVARTSRLSRVRAPSPAPLYEPSLSKSFTGRLRGSEQ
jgi:hypothetical protein